MAPREIAERLDWQKLAYALGGIMVSVALTMASFGLMTAINNQKDIAVLQSSLFTTKDAQKWNDTYYTISQDLEILKTKFDGSRFETRLDSIEAKINTLSEEFKEWQRK